MCEVGMLVLIEAGEIRSFVTPPYRMPLPDILIWGAAAIPGIEAHATATETWPADHQLEFATIIDRDTRRLVIAGASDTFDTPYQLTLFLRMLSEVWRGYDIQRIVLSTDNLADSLGVEAPDTGKSLAGRLFKEAIETESDEPDNEDEEDDEQGIEGEWGEPGTDFRQLTNSAADMPNDLDADIQWWVSVRAGPTEPYQHFLGNFVLQTLVSSGPDVLARFAELTETALPEEDETQRGMLIDAATETISVWSHPKGIRKLKLGPAWSQWSVEQWVDDGFRRQMKLTGADAEYVEASDLQVLSGFVPSLAEQVDLSEMVGEFKSGVRRFVRRGFGCLAMILAFPALLAWAASGSWRGPFAFAGGLWVLAYLAYRILAAKMKKSFSPITTGPLNQDAWLPKLAPESKTERVQIINQSLRGAGLPQFDQIDAFAMRDDDDDEDSERIDPIVRSRDAP